MNRPAVTSPAGCRWQRTHFTVTGGGAFGRGPGRHDLCTPSWTSQVRRLQETRLKATNVEGWRGHPPPKPRPARSHSAEDGPGEGTPKGEDRLAGAHRFGRLARAATHPRTARQAGCNGRRISAGEVTRRRGRLEERQSQAVILVTGLGQCPWPGPPLGSHGDGPVHHASTPCGSSGATATIGRETRGRWLRLEHPLRNDRDN